MPMAAAVAALSSPYSICRNNCSLFSSSSSLGTPLPCLRLGRNGVAHSSLYLTNKKSTREMQRFRSVAEETLVPEEEQKEEAPVNESVSVPVSPSDMLTMFFQAEGTMDESAVPTVTKALEV
uniref:Uncharacterized protein n=1 Tax=Nelumbo nucifera TaxID=4432 RepID=A0A822YTD4_NELNU|nr:TPA_asm: hypothetical protein HUJ06_005309 [Nelumbo nucifera]